jgi:hypothetical protein
VAGLNGGSAAAPKFSPAWAGVLHPGMVTVTASYIRIQRSCELCKRGAGRNQGTKKLDGSHGGVERNTREGLADVERLARAVERSVVVGREPGVGGDAAGEQSAGEAQAPKPSLETWRPVRPNSAEGIIGVSV